MGEFPRVSSEMSSCCPFCQEVECDPDCALARWRPAGDDVRVVMHRGNRIALNLSQHDRLGATLLPELRSLVFGEEVCRG